MMVFQLSRDSLWVLGGSWEENGVCGAGDAKSFITVFPIAPMQPNIDSQYGVSDSVSVMTVAGVIDITSE